MKKVTFIVLLKDSLDARPKCAEILGKRKLLNTCIILNLDYALKFK